MNVVAYPHIQTHRYYTPAETNIEVLDLKAGSERLDQRTLDQHESIYAALAAHDPNLAQAMAVQHVLTTEIWLRQTLAGERDG